MIKASAIANVITVFDLMGQTRAALSRSFDLTIYLYAAMLYLALAELIRRLWDRLEARLTRHLQREPASRPAGLVYGARPDACPAHRGPRRAAPTSDPNAARRSAVDRA